MRGGDGEGDGDAATVRRLRELEGRSEPDDAYIDGVVAMFAPADADMGDRPSRYRPEALRWGVA